ncbi:hypothetical protein, partial [Cronobacter malonaticus]|uniref:hypothetical protein n=1 Tax=Cronobacter malonaticus TaxID=413503 RepID=UPI001F420BD6
FAQVIFRQMVKIQPTFVFTHCQSSSWLNSTASVFSGALVECNTHPESTLMFSTQPAIAGIREVCHINENSVNCFKILTQSHLPDPAERLTKSAISLNCTSVSWRGFEQPPSPTGSIHLTQ